MHLTLNFLRDKTVHIINITLKGFTYIVIMPIYLCFSIFLKNCISIQLNLRTFHVIYLLRGKLSGGGGVYLYCYEYLHKADHA